MVKICSNRRGTGQSTQLVTQETFTHGDTEKGAICILGAGSPDPLFEVSIELLLHFQLYFLRRVFFKDNELELPRAVCQGNKRR